MSPPQNYHFAPHFFDFLNPLYTWLNVSHGSYLGAMCPHENMKWLVFGILPRGNPLVLPLGIRYPTPRKT